jgi:RNA polymerase sigma-70 factor (ECF subfamily)
MVEDKELEESLEAALAQPEPADWLASTYQQHSTAVLQAAYRITGNVADAEDVLQTVFTRLARREQPPDLSRGALPYLRRAATNAALDVVQSARAKTSTSIDDAPPEKTADGGPAADRLHFSRELKDRLRRALTVVNRRQAEMFVLRYLEGLDNREIADYFDTSPGTVAVTLHRVRTRLAEELGDWLGGS